jgi:hypothetical protein
MKVSRNDPCPCGSGRKFKRCCADDVQSLQGSLFDTDESWPAEDDGEDPAGRLAHSLAEAVACYGPEAIPPDMRDLLAENFECLVHFLTGFLAAAKAPPEDPDEDLADAYQYLLQIQLSSLRLALEQNYDWAKQLFESFEQRLIAAIREGEASAAEIVALSGAMFEARIRPGRELVEAGEERFGLESAQSQVGADRTDLLANVVQECGEDPFIIREALFATTHIGSAAFRAHTMRALLTAPAAAMREAAALAVLDPDLDVRRETAAALVEHCRAITPVALRRLIAIRGWLAQPERGLIDQAIRAARLAGTECAQWARGAQVSEVQASAPDGTDVQMAMIITRADRAHQLSGLLFEHGEGITDAWTMEPEPRRAITRMLKEGSSAGMTLLAVSPGYLDRIVGFYLRAGLAQNLTPAVRLLALAELLGASQWQPGQTRWQEMLAELIAAIPDHLLAPDSVRAIIASSANWGIKRNWAASWVEAGQEVDDLLGGLKNRKPRVVRDAILSGIMEKRREIWAQRFALTALWMKEGVRTGMRLPWERFAILAGKLLEEMPLREIPMMNQIAAATLPF